MMHSVHTTDGGETTGTADNNYNLIWFTEQCLSNALRLQTYVEDARRRGDDELADLLGKAQHESAKGAKIAKDLLRRRLGQD